MMDENEMASKPFLEDLQQKAYEVKEHSQTGSSLQETASSINRGLAIYGVAKGLLGSIRALEDGNTEQGAIGLAQSLHGIGKLAGVNRAIYKQSGNVLGKLFHKDVQNIDASVSTINGENAEVLQLAAEGDALSTVGRIGELTEDIPIIGTAFGIYNIYEDFHQHSTIGYIDGALDIAITGLVFLGPEAEVAALALTIVRMSIDTFYADISNELQELPSNATVNQKINAVLKGSIEAGIEVAADYSPTPYGLIDKDVVNSQKASDKLDRQHENDKTFLKKISDYHNYFNVVMETGSSVKGINFAVGSESINGGDITLHL